MKYILLFFAVLFMSALSSSCTGGTNANAEKESSATTSSSSSGDAIFSYNLDGVKVSGGEIDATQTNNVAEVTKTDNSNKLSFFLGDVYQENTETFSHSLRFTVPDKTGMVALTPDGDNGHVELFLATGEEGKYIVYGNESFNITLTNISSTRISGTFSGKLKVATGQGSGKNEVTISDGKFDIPVRSDKQ